MKTADLGGPILRSVSRSFYLSIRILPAPLREPIGLGYLLARASDTIADSPDAPAATRRQHLAAFGTMVNGGDRAGLPELIATIRSDHAGEGTLLTQIGACLDWLAAMEPADRALIQKLLATIVDGQDLDLARFGDGGELAALETAQELEEYTYLVAGCVGEFWTDICLRHLPRYSTLPDTRLRELGVEFGKGLQLVNILRDLPADLRQGRCYLPAEEIPAAQVIAEPTCARPVFARWRQRAETLLGSGQTYLKSLRYTRVRIACFLPWDLGRETLKLLDAHPPLETAVRVKVPRRTVYRSMARALLATLGWG